MAESKNNLMVLDDLDDAVGDWLPPELLLDPHHPSNDEYCKGHIPLKRELMAHTVNMPPKAVSAIKSHMAGKTRKQIAEELNTTPTTVGKYIRSDAGKRLRALLHHIAHMKDGPNIEHRKHVLWRITVNNEKKNPKTAVAAIQEINKMSGTYDPKQSAGPVNITINNQLLPRGPLDTMPETYEARIIENDPDKPEHPDEDV